MSHTLFAIHGAFSGAWCFEPLQLAATRRGWDLHAIDLHPALPDGRPAGLRDYLADCLAAIGRLDGPPVVVGHSMGGLLAQQLAAAGAARAAILLAPAPAWGQFYASVQENVNLMALTRLGPFWDRILRPERRIARDYSMQFMERAQRADALARLTPESGRVLFEINCWGWDPTMASAVAHHRVCCPMMFVTGSADRVISAATVRASAARYGDLALCREYDGLGHFIFGEPGQDAVFRDCLDWLDALDLRVTA